MTLRTVFLALGLLAIPALASADVLPPPDSGPPDAGTTSSSGGCSASPVEAPGEGLALLAAGALAIVLVRRRR